jgi:hypothetical protein
VLVLVLSEAMLVIEVQGRLWRELTRGRVPGYALSTSTV